ncbi:MAG: cyclic nucleotide-binding/CBS domain-containing protein [Nitrososphaerales archaeon]
MSKDPLSAKGDASLRVIVSLMIKNLIGSVIIVDEAGHVKGIVTERDLIREIVTEYPIWSVVPARDFMTKRVIEVDPDTSTDEAAKIMIQKKARLVVTKRGKLVGIVTASDLVRAFSKGRKTVSLKGIVTPAVQTLDSRYSARDAINILHTKRIGSIVVTKNGKAHGLFTERDILTKILAKKRRFDTKLDVVTSKPLITISGDATTKKVATLMASRKIKRLPLVKGKKILGIVTSRDLVEAYSRAS